MPYKIGNRTNVFQCHFQLCPLRAFKNVGLISQVHSKYIRKYTEKKLISFSLSNLCIQTDPSGSAIKDSGTSLGLRREWAQSNCSFTALWTHSYRCKNITEEAHRAPRGFLPLFPSPHLFSFLQNNQWRKWHPYFLALLQAKYEASRRGNVERKTWELLLFRNVDITRLSYFTSLKILPNKIFWNNQLKVPGTSQ